MQERQKVFVYGTLKSNHGNHHILDHPGVIKFGGEIMMYPGHLIDLGPFPGLIKGDELCQIWGELYDVPPEVFARLDTLEGYPHFYNREQRMTKNKHLAWVYFLPAEGYRNYPRVEDNNWRPNGAVHRV